jgi:tetratricopeptide (TPR) repeat protein
MSKMRRNIIITTVYIIAIIILIGLNSFIKIHNFGDGKLYYSDAALRFHYAEIYSQGKKIPVIDNQVLYPEGLRVRTLIHLTMDWVIGNSHRLLFPKIPFTDYVKYFVSIFSSLSVLLVFLLGTVLWQRKASGLIAAIFYTIGIASFWRITGNYLREEFTLPFIFTALYLFSRGFQNSSKIWQKKLFLLLSGISFAIALISWHLSQFFFTVFVIFLIFYFILCTDYGSRRLQPAKQETLQDEPQPKGCGYLFSHLWLFLLPILIVGLIWEPISSKYFIFSFPIVMSVWLWLISTITQEKYRNTVLKKTILALAIIPFYLVIIRLFPKYFAEYGHVFETIIAKIIHLGRKPDNPAALSFDARSIWMGPFASPGPFSIIFSMLVPFILAVIGWLGSLNRNFFKRFDYPRLFLSYFIIAFTVLYLLVIRLEVFLFFFVAIAIGGNLNLILQRKKAWRLLLAILLCGFVIESYKTLNYGKLFERYYLRLSKEWLTKPTAYGSDWESLTNWIKENTKPDQAVLADVDISAMLLTYVGRPIIIEPIYENAITRIRAKECLSAFYQAETDFSKLINKYQIKYIVYQQDFLLDNSKESNRYLTENMKVKKSSAAYLMQFQPESLKYLALSHQTNTFRIYQVLTESEVKPVSPKFPYSPYFDLPLFNQDPKNEFFDDAQTAKIENSIFEALNQYNTATQLMQKNDYQNAIKQLESVTKIFPDFERTYYYLGLCYQKLNYNQQALLYFEKAINSFPNDLDSYVAKASILDAQNNLSEAVVTIISAIKISPTRTDLFSNLGYFYIKRQLIDYGLTTFKTLAESLPVSSPLHLYTGYLYGYKNDLTDAENEFNKALAFDSTNPEVYEAFGSLYLQRKELGKAISYFEKSLKLNPNQPKITQILSDLRKSFH